jgi:hypothetical protein
MARRREPHSAEYERIEEVNFFLILWINTIAFVSVTLLQ